MPARITLVTITALMLCGPALAQPYGTDILATTTAGQLYRIQPSGQWQALVTFQSLPNMVCMDNNNRDILVVTYQSPAALLVVDPTVNAVVRTIWSGAPFLRMDYFAPLHTGDFVVSGTALPFTPALFLVKHDGSGVTTLHAGAPLRGPQAVLQDLGDGRVLVGDLTSQTLYHVALDGTVNTVFISALNYPFSMTQDHTDGSILLGPGGRSWLWGFFRYSIAARTLTTLNGPNVVVNANAICFDRWRGSGEIVVGAGPVYRTDGRGTVITTFNGLPWNNTGMCFDQGRNIVTSHVSSPNQWRLDVNFPGEAGRPYALALSLTGFTPPIPVDIRAVPLVFDDLVRLSLDGSLAALLRGNLGTLNLSDRAAAHLDLRQFRNRLQGIKVWTAAVTLDAGAPSGIATISKPYVLLLE